MYNIFLTRHARKDLAKLSDKDRVRVRDALKNISENPFAGKKLEGKYEGSWSIRVWPHRIIYTIQKDIVTVTVFKISHRKDVYR